MERDDPIVITGFGGTPMGSFEGDVEICDLDGSGRPWRGYRPEQI